ncbi:LysM peptidoglycan-binding domain-containing protein [Peribacillus saganii]|uniref:LysM peptidoglycan-binding domain-containing protein n=1 Tax=Peribacillus saganii TaxID=2303992 RepID=A0A372LLR4_9BACI|nr:3D domain-containing protein [Peribacillus saganii]RFU67908.1 LysM peptidoglycan-binding domain-containing protein [Peribacillus saganii]
MKKLLLNVSAAILVTFGFTGMASASPSTYQVKSGDTLWSIAKRNGLTVQQIKSWNKLTSDTIKLSQVLKLAPGVQKNAPVKTAAAKPAAKQGAFKELTMTATAYTASCKGCSGITATGLNLKKNPSIKAISVDPRIIPLGSKVYVEGYGYAVAADKGSAVKGSKIDVFIPNKSRAIKWGSKTVKVKVFY